MNTPSHAILSVFALGKGADRKITIAILFGAILPDLPMLVFYAWVKGVRQLSETEIWSTEYFRPEWQTFIDVFNAFPVIALGAVISRLLGWRVGVYLFASMALHALFDLPVHVDDGHAHFWPFTDWRFASPISYWDPNHYGAIVAAVEAATMGVFSAYMGWKRYANVWTRRVLVLLGSLYLVAGIFLALSSLGVFSLAWLHQH